MVISEYSQAQKCSSLVDLSCSNYYYEVPKVAFCLSHFFYIYLLEFFCKEDFLFSVYLFSHLCYYDSWIFLWFIIHYHYYLVAQIVFQLWPLGSKVPSGTLLVPVSF